MKPCPSSRKVVRLGAPLLHKQGLGEVRTRSKNLPQSPLGKGGGGRCGFPVGKEGGSGCVSPIGKREGKAANLNGNGDGLIGTLSGTTIIGVATLIVATQMLMPELENRAQAAPTQAATSGSNASGAKPVRVEVAQPTRRPLTRTLKTPATLKPYESADLYAKTSGYVSSVEVDLGSRVSRGDALLKIDVPEMADELRQAQAVLAAKGSAVSALQAKAAQADSVILTARAEVERAAAELALWKITADRKKQLREEKAIPEQDFDEAQNRLAVAEAQRRIAEARVTGAEAERRSAAADIAVARSQVAVEQANVRRLETLMKYATIRAPFDGVITDRMVDTGAFVRSAAEGTTTALLTIVRVRRLRLALDIPEVDAAHVRVGTKVDIVVPALGGDPISATVSRTAVALRAATRTLRVEVDLENPDMRLAAGMYAKVAVQLEYQASAMVIPSKAIRASGHELSVWLAAGGVIKPAPVTIGYDDGIWAEVLSGLEGDERIILSTGGGVAPGQRVSAVPAG